MTITFLFCKLKKKQKNMLQEARKHIVDRMFRYKSAEDYFLHDSGHRTDISHSRIILFEGTDKVCSVFLEQLNSIWKTYAHIYKR